LLSSQKVTGSVFGHCSSFRLALIGFGFLTIPYDDCRRELHNPNRLTMQQKIRMSQNMTDLSVSDVVRRAWPLSEKEGFKDG
jgi:hypothetical protein